MRNSLLMQLKVQLCVATVKHKLVFWLSIVSWPHTIHSFIRHLLYTFVLPQNPAHLRIHMLHRIMCVNAGKRFILFKHANIQFAIRPRFVVKSFGIMACIHWQMIVWISFKWCGKWFYCVRLYLHWVWMRHVPDWCGRLFGMGFRFLIVNGLFCTGDYIWKPMQNWIVEEQCFDWLTVFI